METKKKRIRPTLREVRELKEKERVLMEIVAEMQQDLDEYPEVLHDRCMEADGWRDRYRALKASFDKERQENGILRNKMQKMYKRGLWQRIMNNEV